MKTHGRNIFPYHVFRYYFLLITLILISSNAVAQCPENIDFERGDFSNWRCDTGSITIVGTQHVITLHNSPPLPNRHVIQNATPGDGIDFYGDFPVNCPNGSGHSIRLGNSLAKQGVERVYYTFTIPPGKNDFTLSYNYAIVLQDPGHFPEDQPKLSIEVINITDNIKDTCASFDFVVNGGLPGFLVSTKTQDGIPVRYKNWSAASINLQGQAGKTYRIFFTTMDCALGDHFGYAYLDFNPGCSKTILDKIFCPTDPKVDLTAPAGFQSYRWFDNANTTLGTEQTISFNPPPHAGDTVHVHMIPYDGYGCEETLTAYLWDTLTVVANAGPDRQYCVNGIQLGEPPKEGINYSWSPATGLNDRRISNPVATPTMTNTQYTLTATSGGGGCMATDEVNLVKKCDVIELYVPNAFNPTSNVNNRLRPFMYGFSRVNYFRVYNRYGQLLYSANSDLPGWDGTIKGKPAATQTVVWVVEAVDAYGRTEKRQGTSILLR